MQNVIMIKFTNLEKMGGVKDIIRKFLLWRMTEIAITKILNKGFGPYFFFDFFKNL